MNQALPIGTVLRGKAYTYTIEKVLGQGSFGITYLASFAVPGPLGEITAVAAVKEFFAKDLDFRLPDGSVSARTEAGVAYRYARAFRRESENLSKMKHPGIVHVLEAFEANGTFYYAMEYLSGGSLDNKVKGVGMPEAEALPMIARIGEALSYMHSCKMIHLDLKPKNIMLKRDGSPVIIDFGLSKQFNDIGEPESSSTIGLGTPGYAPIEQAFQSSGNAFQPTLDIYALGATLYKMLTGATPPVSSSILEDGFPESELEAKQVSGQTIEAIREAMLPSRKDRPQSVSEFLDLLSSEMEEEPEGTEVIPFVKTEPESLPEPEPDPGPEPDPEPEPEPEPEPVLVPEPEPAPEEVVGPVFINGIRVEEEPELIPESKPKSKPDRKSGKGDDGPWRPKAWPLWLIAGIVALAMSVLIISESLSDGRHDGNTEVLSYVNLGLPSGTLWKDCNEPGLFSFDEAVSKFGNKGLPGQEEWEELYRSCRWTWTGRGYRATGPNGKSIELPADGYRDADGNVTQVGFSGFFWSSDVFELDTLFAYGLNFVPDGDGYVPAELCTNAYDRRIGHSVRLVLKH